MPPTSPRARTITDNLTPTRRANHTLDAPDAVMSDPPMGVETPAPAPDVLDMVDEGEVDAATEEDMAAGKL